MILSEFFKSFFTIKKFPSQNEIVISRMCQRVALGLLIIGIVILAAAFVATVYKILFFSGLKVEVGSLVFGSCF